MKPANVTLLGCVIVTFVLGSIHAFSVFLLPWESLLAAPRAQISLIYSMALVCLTFSVLIGYKIYPLLPAPTLAGLSCVMAGVGTCIAGNSSSFLMVALGYAVIFGGANGIGYGFVLQLSAQAMPQRKGFAMGTVTACYALGASIAPSIYKFGLTVGGLTFALNLASGILIIAGIIVFFLLRVSGSRYIGENKDSAAEVISANYLQVLLWLAYGTGSATGLMIIGHATGLMLSVGGSTQLAIICVMFIALGNMSGGLIAGWLADRIKLKVLLIGLPALSSVSALLLSVNNLPHLLLIGLTVIGFCYGAIIALYPVVVSTLFGAAASSRIYGRVFTAWGLVGLLGPWFAGYLFDQTGQYTLALVIASGVSLVSVFCVLLIQSVKHDSPA